MKVTPEAKQKHDAALSGLRKAGKNMQAAQDAVAIGLANMTPKQAERQIKDAHDVSAAIKAAGVINVRQTTRVQFIASSMVKCQ